MTLCTCGPSQFDKVALPAIIDYKVTEARCEKLPKLLPQLFSEVPEVDRRYANPNRNPNPNPNQVPEAEQLRRYAVLHQKYKQPLFDIFMQLGGAPYASCPRARLCFSAGVMCAAQASTARAARRSPPNPYPNPNPNQALARPRRVLRLRLASGQHPPRRLELRRAVRARRSRRGRRHASAVHRRRAGLLRERGRLQ